jgi:acetyl-CoA/propionyl-CoA carboxylase biotin carboxyl carrier protein
VTPRPSQPTHRISSVLVANRGEIVVRVCRTLARRGIRSVAVYTAPDAGALHVGRADVALEVGSYLDAGALVAAAVSAGADAVHPGYGFLSEDPAFARAVAGAGLVWIGPPPEAIEAMGDKIRAKETVARAGVPVVPGVGGAGMSDADLVEAAVAVGLPVLLKPAAGGGGKGMRRVSTRDDLPLAIEAARREAQGAFGDGTLLVERWLPRPRHVEVQVFADSIGGAVHLGERECTLQRRHQKIVEESPSPLLDAATRDAMTRSALAAARSVGYVGAGTVEFIVSADRPDEFYFMEMNTRLQVEHPVTEAVTGLDLVEWQIRVAEGEPLPLGQDAVRFEGHAVEARVYAEDPARGFLPTGGTVALVEEPVGRAGVRVDSSLAAGTVVGSRYDPMLAKVIAHGSSRGEALARLREALAATTVLGVTTNVAYLVRLLGHPDVVAGRLDTGLVERTLDELIEGPGGGGGPGRGAAAAAVGAAAALVVARSGGGPSVDPWDVADGWRLAGQGEWTLRLRRGGPLEARARSVVRIEIVGPLVTSSPGADPATVRVEGGAPVSVTVRPDGGARGGLEVAVDGVTSRWRSAVAGTEVWVGRGGRAWRFEPDRVARGDVGASGAGTGPVTSPMPGVVVAVKVAPGDEVRAGQVLVVVEAMKMEHAVAATGDGVVRAVSVRPGQQVGLDEALVEVD